MIAVRNLKERDHATSPMFSSFPFEQPVEEPVDGEDDGDVLSGQTHGVEHHDHRDEAGLPRVGL